MQLKGIHKNITDKYHIFCCCFCHDMIDDEGILNAQAIVTHQFVIGHWTSQGATEPANQPTGRKDKHLPVYKRKDFSVLSVAKIQRLVGSHHIM